MKKQLYVLYHQNPFIAFHKKTRIF